MNFADSINMVESVDWSDKLVLIAEDDSLNFRLLKSYLKRTGIRIIWAQTGLEAIEMLNANPDIQMALMDIQMPVMSGIEATLVIKKMRNDIPVIMQTAYGLAEHREESYKAGCDEFLAKPFEMAELLHAMKKHFMN